eukprot:1194499-Prorocentrum_minimum.AAC.4
MRVQFGGFWPQAAAVMSNLEIGGFFGGLCAGALSDRCAPPTPTCENTPCSCKLTPAAANTHPSPATNSAPLPVNTVTPVRSDTSCLLNCRRIASPAHQRARSPRMISS